MNLHDEYVNNFDATSFKDFVVLLESQGYIIDTIDPFSSTQVKHMTEDMLQVLCKKFNINTDVRINSTGCYHPAEGGFSIVFDENQIDLDKARKILKNKIFV